MTEPPPAYPSAPAAAGRESSNPPGGVLFLFSGQGGEHARMGRALAARYPVFARVVDAATDAVVRAGGRRVWTPRHGFAKSLETPDVAQPALFAYQLALAKLLNAWGIRADAVAGHGVGEIAGAVVSGALALSDGARVAVARGHALMQAGATGATAVLTATPEEVRRLVEPVRGSVAITAVDGPRSVVVSGVPRYVETLVRRARRRDLPVRLLADDPARQPRSMSDILPDFMIRLEGVVSTNPRVPIYSTVRGGQVITTAELTIDYWSESVCGPVDLAAALGTAASGGISTVVELAPHPVLETAVRFYAKFRDSTYPMADRNNEAEAFLAAVARMYAEGRVGHAEAVESPSAQRDPEPDGLGDGGFAPPRIGSGQPATLGPSGSTKPTAVHPTNGHDDTAAEMLRGTAVYDPTVATATEWARSILSEECWVTAPEHVAAQSIPSFRRVLVVGESALATALERQLDRRLPTLRVARDPADAGPIVSSMLTDHATPTAVTLVWPDADRSDSPLPDIASMLDLLQRAQGNAATATLSMVLRDRGSLTQNAVAGLARSLQLESRRPTRLVWATGDEPAPIVDLILNPTGPEEVLVDGHTLRTRHFRPAPAATAPIAVRPGGTYVVTGGLGALGSVAVRWLLDAGARDVVVLTRTPRPLPRLHEGVDDRIVVVRCDVTDRADLANALFDIRACGSTIRGVVHAAGIRRRSEFRSVTSRLLADSFEPRVTAAANLLDLTGTDPIDFVLLSSSATGALGASDRAADAAAHAALDALARNRTDEHIVSIGWGDWISGPTASADHADLLRAGITPFDVARGIAALSVVLSHRAPSVLAVDYSPTDDTSPLAERLRGLLPERAGRAFPATNGITTPLGFPTAATLATALTEGFPHARHHDPP
ncbi:SDR family NAD(P)-dependent oxidoreductase [Nocardia mexicana]|uniref:KR domain-containing protein n=1 Tax=Nocardia mexicana TaxID=279262 RepID=A0A370GXB6_9NOCA|nr:SDR family NAD(P)-dependent oxidoreductase [Nocardia mexicana]RDI48201.1 KR domain-containing protein [Nocardia mexicana]